jgi:hypothetical protein
MSLKIRQLFRINKTEKVVKKQDKNKKALDQDIAFLTCPPDLDPEKKGRHAGLYTNFGDKVGQGIILARQSKYNPMQKGFDMDFKINTMNKLNDIARTHGASVVYNNVQIMIAKDEQAMMLKRTYRKIRTVKKQVQYGDASTTNAMYNDAAEKELTAHIQAIYNGEDYYSWFAMPCLVVADNKKKVDEVISAIRKECTEGGIRIEVPKWGQHEVIKSANPLTNYVNASYLQPVNGRTIAAMLPIRNHLAAFPKDGVIICTDEATGEPIKLSPSKKNPENTLIMCPPGGGKTTMVFNFISHAIGMGHDIRLITPKNEDADGTDYINFCNKYDGALSRWGAGEGDVNPDPLIIYYDKKRMGTRMAAYRKAKSDHKEIVKSMFSAWVGGLNPRQIGLISYCLMHLYIQRGVLDKDGDPINTELWDVPGAINWPSIHEFRMYVKELYNDPSSEFYNDPSLDAFIMKTMDAEPGCDLWWWANSKKFMDISKQLQVFDISQVPDSLKPAIAIQIMGAINTLYFPKPNDGSPRKRTWLIFDELRNLVRTQELIPHVERSEREGRAPGVSGIYITQDPIFSDDGKFMKTLRANCKNVIFLCNLDNTNFDIFQHEFHFEDKYIPRLMQKGNGIGLYFRDRIGTNVRIEVDEMPANALFESQRGAENIDVTMPTTHEFEVREEYRKIYEMNGFFLNTWLKSPDKRKYPGYKNYTPYDPLGHGGSMSAWIREDLIKIREGKTKAGKDLQDLIGPEGEIHFCCECRIAGWLHKEKFPNVKTYARDRPDVTWGEDENGVPSEDSGCVEIESQGTHNSVDDFNGKLKRARDLGYKTIIFTGHSSACKEMMKEGSHVINYVFPQGEKYLLPELERIRDELRSKECKMKRLTSKNQVIKTMSVETSMNY